MGSPARLHRSTDVSEEVGPPLDTGLPVLYSKGHGLLAPRGREGLLVWGGRVDNRARRSLAPESCGGFILPIGL